MYRIRMMISPTRIYLICPPRFLIHLERVLIEQKYSKFSITLALAEIQQISVSQQQKEQWKQTRVLGGSSTDTTIGHKWTNATTSFILRESIIWFNIIIILCEGYTTIHQHWLSTDECRMLICYYKSNVKTPKQQDWTNLSIYKHYIINHKVNSVINMHLSK